MTPNLSRSLSKRLAPTIFDFVTTEKDETRIATIDELVTAERE